MRSTLSCFSAKPPSRQGGFTLMEIMVVIVIIAVITSAITLRLTAGGKKHLDEEARRVNALVRLASEQALLQGRDIGMSIENDGYSFYIYDYLQQSWLSLDTEKIFRARTMPYEIRLDLTVEENDVTWPEREDEIDIQAEDEDDEENEVATIPTPQILMLSSGEITPFDLYFHKDDVEPALQLQVDAAGERTLITHEFGF